MKTEGSNFIEDIIIKDLEDGRCSCVQTRHPPEPSGYLHIGHVRNIVLNYGLAEKFGGICNLRYDDTNPTKESQEFVDSIQDDVKWLGYHWNKIHYATDYFQANYDNAIKLIKSGKAYVCDLSPEELSKFRGSLTEPGQDSPYRNRTIEENLDLFERMKNGEFPAGSRCLRAKIDMKSPNMNMRDPVIYRIQYEHHQRIGNTWCVYPSYDFSHPMDDSLEGVTHSICGPEFEDHRPLYDWVIENCGLENKSRQIEYANLRIKGVILGKRFIKKLVEQGKVSGFDDPRLYTVRGLRRRGVLPESLKSFVFAAGISKSNAIIEPSFLEHFIREDLNAVSRRVMAVIDPVKLIIENYPADTEEEVFLEDYPQNENSTVRSYFFSRECYVEREDFIKIPDPKFHRLQVGSEVRLKGAYIVKCTGFEEDENGNVTKILCTYDPETKSKEGSSRKVKGTIHWINPSRSKKITVRLFNDLIIEDEESKNLPEGEYNINPESLIEIENAYLEDSFTPSQEDRYQFIRCGYFCLDKDSNDKKLIFNRTITLKETKKPDKK